MSKDVSINVAIQQLGITKYEAENLDAMDGKKDGKIKASVFDEAKTTLENAKPAEKGSQNEEIQNFSGFSDVAKGVAMSLAKRMGLSGYFFSDNPDYKGTQQDENGDTVIDPNLEKMAELTSAATDYIYENDTTNLNGFTYEDGLPNNVDNVNINTELLYTDGSNDTVTFDENGNGNVEKNPDEAVTRTKYSVNGENYELGYIWGDE